MFNTNLITAPIKSAIAGIYTLFSPYNPPLIVWLSAINTIDIEASVNIPAPSGALGYIKFNIWFDKHINPIAHGIIIIIEAKNENDNLFDAKSYSFFAIDSDIAGTSAVEKAKLTAIGRFINVSTFDSIPAFSIANCSNASFPPSIKPVNACWIQLLTVAVSITELITEIMEPIVIGIEKAKIVFIILLSEFTFFSFSISLLSTIILLLL